MKPFNVFLTACAFGFLGGVITGESAFAEDCKYQKNVQLAENGSILSADTTYECVKSQPIIVLDPVVSDVVVRNKANETDDLQMMAAITQLDFQLTQ